VVGHLALALEDKRFGSWYFQDLFVKKMKATTQPAGLAESKSGLWLLLTTPELNH
jgi:hypothetical protein